jgi:hypothetical protein
MDIKVLVDEEKRQVSLHLEVTINNQDDKYKTIHAQEWLVERGYSLGRIIKHDVVENKGEKEKLCKGHWIFRLKTAPAQDKVAKPEKTAAVVKEPVKKKLKSKQEKTEE